MITHQQQKWDPSLLFATCSAAVSMEVYQLSKNVLIIQSSVPDTLILQMNTHVFCDTTYTPWRVHASMMSDPCVKPFSVSNQNLSWRLNNSPDTSQALVWWKIKKNVSLNMQSQYFLDHLVKGIDRAKLKFHSFSHHHGVDGNPGDIFIFT